MKIIKIAQENPFRNEGVDPLESPLRDQLETEQERNKINEQLGITPDWKENWKESSIYIDNIRDQINNLNEKLQKSLEARDLENWDFFKK